MRLVSWNINGARAVARKGFGQWLEAAGADIVALQEVRASAQEATEALALPAGWHLHVVSAAKKGYSGVALLSRERPQSIETEMKVPEFDSEGRVQLAAFPGFVLANVYFPNGSGLDRDNGRVPFKLAFYEALFDWATARASAIGRPLVVVGDFNTAHAELDIRNARSNEKTSGFLPIEREAFGSVLRRGLVDTYRERYPDRIQYTWWSQRIGVREKNIGWRIDYVLAQPAIAARISDAFILDHVMGSDHCPIGVDLR